MGKIKDISGQKFNRLTPLFVVGRDKGGQALWNCLCDCGKEVVIQGSRVANGYTRSCGCLLLERKPKNILNITGQKFGLLTAVRLADKRMSGRVTWVCRCDCGNETRVTQNNLTRDNTTSCGCLHRAACRANGRKNKRHDSGCGLLYNRYSESAKKRGLIFSISRELFADITSRVCHYCGDPPGKLIYSHKAKVEYKFNGIDRIDNSKGYEETNCLPCCAICNHAKHVLSYNDFINWLKRAGQHQLNSGVA